MTSRARAAHAIAGNGTARAAARHQGADRHIRILRLMAQQRQRALRSFDASRYDGDLGSLDDRRYLERAATRTSARVADAQARRRRSSMRPGRDSPPMLEATCDDTR
jgi:hypothetical protein